MDINERIQIRSWRDRYWDQIVNAFTLTFVYI